MNKSTLIILFITVHISFIFLQIYKHTAFIKTAYQKQKYEQLIDALTQKKEERTQALYALKNKTRIQQYAQEQLHMQPISLQQIKTVQR